MCIRDSASFAVVGHLNTGIGGFLPARFHIPLDKADALIEQNDQAAGEFRTVKMCIRDRFQPDRQGDDGGQNQAYAS